MIVVGLDLSLTSTGMAIFDNGLLTEVDNVKSKGKATDTLYDRYIRHDRLQQDILDFTLGYVGGLPDLVVIESPSFGSIGGSAHDRSGLWWRVASGVMDWAVPVGMVAPTTRAKYATGSGATKDKKVVVAHVIERYVNESTPRITNDDQADAVALAAMGCRWLGEPVEAYLPEANLEAMRGAKWPQKAA